ncbi:MULTISPECIES: fimbrial protein [Pseudomonas]|uniref:Fimbrial protein n=1 Tax=Pseudomonas fluorescens TaxID=294 RepID=A0A0N7H0E2_PSEFL|nr:MULTISPECIES: fimbrial protein [Pseudomonas]ALI02892.1 fimbrial protein [Pseudomonas fluorescens]
MAIRLTLWGALLTVAVLCSAQVCQAAPTARLDIRGTLIQPPCSANFPSTQNVEIPKVNLNALGSGMTDWTDVAFDFQCTKGSKLQLRFTAGNGAYDTATLRTTLDKLGLKTRLSDVTGTVRDVHFNLGEQFTFFVEATALNLKLSVRPVLGAQELPAIGSYNATLMMEIVYL